MQKKIAIITHPLQYNYGGILQAFALSHILSKYGTVFVLKKTSNIKDILKCILELLQPFHIFKRLHIKERPISFKSLYKKLQRLNIDTLVIGSDQVWRPDFVRNYMTFGQFLPINSSIKLFAYAASFGNNQWDFTEEQTKQLQLEVRKFYQISVREQSGIKLCQKYLHTDAQWVLDPTLLLEKNIYLDFIQIKNNKQNFFCYLLDDRNKFNKEIINKITKETGYKLDLLTLNKNKILKRIQPTPSVPEWLSKIYNSKIVLTDSFHGCAFCILFNKTFFVLENETGGNERIHSLLHLFQLESRIIRSSNYSFNEKQKIDWERVNKILTQERKKSLLFIKETINGL